LAFELSANAFEETEIAFSDAYGVVILIGCVNLWHGRSSRPCHTSFVARRVRKPAARTSAFELSANASEETEIAFSDAYVIVVLIGCVNLGLKRSSRPCDTIFVARRVRNQQH
jgi:nitrate reductase gamma subunit